MAEKLPCAAPSWSDIPLELAGLVLHLLPAYVDRARFGAVCPQWRAAARQLAAPPPMPLLALPDGTFYSLPCTEPFRFAGCGFAGFKSACGSWLVFPRHDGCFLVNPFSRATVRLPALSSVRPSCLPSGAGFKPVEPLTRIWPRIKNRKHQLNKLTFCSPNLVAAFVDRHGRGQILVCQPGASSWSSVPAHHTCKGFQDMAFYKGKLYMLSYHEHLSVVDISQDQATGDPQVSRIVRVINGNLFPWFLPQNNIYVHKKLYLVESHGGGGALVMVRRQVCCRWMLGRYVVVSNKFDVFEAGHLKRPTGSAGWVNKTTLGDDDQVLFLGRRCSQLLAPASRYGLLGDRIWFLDDDEDSFKGYCYEEEEASNRVYDMTAQVVSSPLPTVSWKRLDMCLATWLLPQNST
ncbi:uncharacterized protein LOC124670980 [Lolium rigidum]|uniref:uncharacterized protein LOC124670980 n=1 Tax=Lolium rigidum TaxID=89674 RepID=UPI001F5C437A|nr:uncharacterized protein LOC124670980 [Lolium rigidum]